MDEYEQQLARLKLAAKDGCEISQLLLRRLEEAQQRAVLKAQEYLEGQYLGNREGLVALLDDGLGSRP